MEALLCYLTGNNMTGEKVIMCRPFKIWIAILLISVPFAAAQTDILLYTIQEELPVNTLIGDVSKDSGITERLSPDIVKQFKYSFLDTPVAGGDNNNNKASDLFMIDESSGLLKTAIKIDRDVICPHKSICSEVVEIAISPAQHFRIITVNIDILDINDNVPVFGASNIEKKVSESMKVGSVIALLPTAEDPDSGIFGISGYQLNNHLATTDNLPLNSIDMFELEENKALDGSTELKLILLQPLDREIVSFYQLEVTAFDGVVPSQSGTLLVNVTILDTNDNPPVFTKESYSVDVPEDKEKLSTILTVTARDSDIGTNSVIVYGFTSRTQENLGDIFDIDPNTGEIYLEEELDFETESFYQLVVTAKDRGLNTQTSQVAVMVNVLDINDYEPQITINTLTESGQAEVLEHAPEDTFVAYLSVNDLDSGYNGDVVCGLNTTTFKLKQMQLLRYTIVTNAMLDREINDMYIIGLTCEDQGTPSLATSKALLVVVLDTNDHSPIFRKSLYSANIEENNPDNEFILQVNATDKDIGDNGEVSFILSPDNTDDINDMFDINKSGVLRARRMLDHEKYTSVLFQIIAKDNGVPVRSSTARVSIEILDVNDCKPVFTKQAYSFGAYENKLAGDELGNVAATDCDGSPYNDISYQLKADTIQALENFRIDTKQGFIKTEHPLDREVESTYYLTVIAFNPGYPGMSSSASVTIYVSDVNDNSPVIDFPSPFNYTVNIHEDIQPGYVITRIRAHDNDMENNAQLYYELGDMILNLNDYSTYYSSDIGEVENLFNIDIYSGALTVMESIPERSNINQYNLTILVKDNGSPQKVSTAILVINVKPESAIGGVNNDSGMVGKTRPNFTIVIAVACGSTLVIVTLILAIILLSYRGRRPHQKTQDQGQYNCRVTEEQRMLNGKIDRSEYTSPTHSSSSMGNKNSPEHTVITQHHTIQNECSPELKTDTVTQMNEHGMVNGKQPPTTRVPHNTSCIIASDKTDKFATKLVPLTDKEIEIHKILKFLHSQQEPGDDHCDSLSTSDSGKGNSVTEDCHTQSSSRADSSMETAAALNCLPPPAYSTNSSQSGVAPSRYNNTTAANATKCEHYRYDQPPDIIPSHTSHKPYKQVTFSSVPKKKQSNNNINDKNYSKYYGRNSAKHGVQSPVSTFQPQEHHNEMVNKTQPHYSSGDNRRYTETDDHITSNRHRYGLKGIENNYLYPGNKKGAENMIHMDQKVPSGMIYPYEPHRDDVDAIKCENANLGEGSEDICLPPVHDSVSVNGELSDADTNSTMSGSYVLHQDDKVIKLDLTGLRDSTV